jgi:hypothetical protein
MATPIAKASGFQLLSWVTAINVLIACGFSLAALIRPESILPSGMEPTRAAFIFAAYAAARSVPLTLIVLIAIYKRSTHALVAFGTLAGFIQLGDFIVGLVQGDIGKAIGPFIIAVLQFYALITRMRSLAKTLQTE